MLAYRLCNLLSGCVLLFLLVPAVHASPEQDAAIVRELAEEGNDSAQLLLGLAYLRGDWGLAQSPAVASRWLEQAALAGNAYAQDRLADLYEAGDGVARSAVLAKDWREKAAHRGNVHAQLKLAETYLQRGSPADLASARQWLERARSAGSADTSPLLRSLEASAAAQLAARARDAAGTRPFPELQWLIERIRNWRYVEDQALHQRPAKLQDVARDGDPFAQYALGRQLEAGREGARDMVAAVRSYERAAGANHLDAMHRLARLYTTGANGVQADPQKARYWARRAAEAEVLASPDEPREVALGARSLALDIQYELVAFVLSMVMVTAYYRYLSRKLAADPTCTIHGVNQLARRLWVLHVMSNPSRDVMAVQTLRNYIMGASLMASTATLLIIGTLTLSGQADSISRSWQVLNINGSHAAEIWVVKVLLLLITFIVAFFAFAMCVRLTNHVLFMMNVPNQAAHAELSPENVARRLNRAGSVFAIGMRAFFFAIPLAFWLFGPAFLLVATIGLVATLHRVDLGRMGAASESIVVPE